MTHEVVSSPSVILDDWTESTFPYGCEKYNWQRSPQEISMQMFRDRYPPPTPIAAPFSAPASARTSPLCPVTFPRCVFFERVFTPEEQRERFARRHAAYNANFRINNLKPSTRLIKGFGISSAARNLDLFPSRR